MLQDVFKTLYHEQAFVLFSDGWVLVYRRRNKRFAECCVLERNRFGGGGYVMVWAAIGHGYRSPLVATDGNLNDILSHHGIPLLHNNANILIVQHENATSHTVETL